jgi:hypothetical protein
VVAVYVVLLLLFHSATLPLVILAAVPLCGGGAFGMLLLLSTSLLSMVFPGLMGKLVDATKGELPTDTDALLDLGKSDSVALLLKMLRETGAPQKMMAPACQFQQNLPQGKTFHLLRLRLDASLGLIPEISGNRLMVSIRFMRRGDDDRLHSGTDDCPFELTLCA